MESRFGHDFGKVRVFSDAQADACAQTLNARAYTVGNDLVFGQGHYDPQSKGGQRLLAHELTHVIQHGGGGGPVVPAKTNVSARGDTAEQEAEQVADRVASGEDVSVQAGTAPQATLHRSPEPGAEDDSSPFPFPFHNPTVPLAPGMSAGTGPPKAGEPGDWYYGGRINGGDGYLGMGYDGGFGYHDEGELAGGVNASVDWLNFNAKAGEWKEGNDNRYGWKMGGGVSKTAINPGGFLTGDMGAGTASVEANAGADGFSLGAQANAVEGSVTLGAPGKDKVNNESVRLGLSAGLGLAGRGHWGDKDGDGHREYGFGFDAGPVSMDLKTEDPALTFLKNPLLLGGALGWGVDTATDDGKFNLTDWMMGSETTPASKSGAAPLPAPQPAQAAPGSGDGSWFDW